MVLKNESEQETPRERLPNHTVNNLMFLSFLFFIFIFNFFESELHVQHENLRLN